MHLPQAWGSLALPGGTHCACMGLGPGGTCALGYLCFALGDGSRILLQQLVAQAGDLLLDAHHDVRVVLVAFHLVGEVLDALLHEVILPAQVGLDGLQERRGWSPIQGAHRQP